MSKMVYTWKLGSRVKMKAAIAGAELARLKKEEGIVTPERVVAVSKPVKAPLHPAFEWDDAIAGHEYRIDQARRIINSISVVREGEPLSEAVRVYASVTDPETDKRAFIPVEEAMRDKTMREQVLADALRDMESFERRYRRLEELSEVIAVQRKVRAQVARGAVRLRSVSGAENHVAA